MVDAHATKLSRYRRGVLSNGLEWPLVVVVVFAFVEIIGVRLLQRHEVLPVGSDFGHYVEIRISHGGSRRKSVPVTAEPPTSPQLEH